MANKPSQNPTPKPVEAPKTENPKREKKPAPTMPENKFEGEAKAEFQALVAGSKAIVDAFANAKHVPVAALRHARMATNAAVIEKIRIHRKAQGPSVEKKREKLLKQIEKAKKALEDLGAA